MFGLSYVGDSLEWAGGSSAQSMGRKIFGIVLVPASAHMYVPVCGTAMCPDWEMDRGPRIVLFCLVPWGPGMRCKTSYSFL